MIKLGQAALVTIFVIGMVSILLGLTLVTTGVGESFLGRGTGEGSTALYAAETGIEEMLYRIKADPGYGLASPAGVSNLPVGEGLVSATVSGDLNTRIATATGVFRDKIRVIEVQVASSSAQVPFAFAVLSGAGGFFMRSNAQVSGVGGAPGNVFSNGDILGSGNSRIIGNAWAVNNLSRWNSGEITATGDASANSISYCEVDGDTYSPSVPTNCEIEGTVNIAPAPTPMPFANINIPFWQQAAQAGGTHQGNITVGGNDSLDLGPLEITGNLTTESNSRLYIHGPLWVHGRVQFKSNTRVYLDNAFGSSGTVILADHPTDKTNLGKIILESNTRVFQTSQGGSLLLISTNTSLDCNNPAISVTSNADAILLYTNTGCVKLDSNANLKALAGEKVLLDSNAQVSYGSGFATSTFATGQAGAGWAVTSWRELP